MNYGQEEARYIFHGQVNIADCLGLDALGRVNNQQRALAGGQTA